MLACFDIHLPYNFLIVYNQFELQQRHFCVFALSLPTRDALTAIYSSILSQHMAMNNFPNLVQRYCPLIVQASIAFQAKMVTSFLPTAIKFHYIFNLRDMSNIFQVGMHISVVLIWEINSFMTGLLTMNGYLRLVPDLCIDNHVLPSFMFSAFLMNMFEVCLFVCTMLTLFTCHRLTSSISFLQFLKSIFPDYMTKKL